MHGYKWPINCTRTRITAHSDDDDEEEEEEEEKQEKQEQEEQEQEQDEQQPQQQQQHWEQDAAGALDRIINTPARTRHSGKVGLNRRTDSKEMTNAVSCPCMPSL